MSFWKSSEQNYSVLARVIHWFSAITVIILFTLGLWMTTLTYYSPWYQTAPNIHISLGFILVCLTLFRFVYRMLVPYPHSLPAPRAQMFAAKLIHAFFYIAIISMFITGYLIDTAEGQPLLLFGYFELPAIVSAGEGVEDTVGKVHLYLAYTIIGVAVLHAAAALKHHFIDKDSTLIRMIKKQ